MSAILLKINNFNVFSPTGRLTDSDLVQTMVKQGTDLVVIEGMGRAIHTNFEARFSCDALKVAVLKNRWLAKRLGGDMFSVVFKFEHVRSRNVCASDASSNNTS